MYPTKMKKRLNVQGMHCSSCKLLLEKSLSIAKNIEKVQANITNGTVDLEYNREPNIEDIKTIIHECGYKVVEDEIHRPWLSKNINDYKIMIISLLAFIVLYFILSSTGFFSFDITSQGNPSLSLVALIGLTAGFSSCMAVVGGLVLAISSKRNTKNENQTLGQKIVPQLRFNIGRITGFGFLGGLLGLFGSLISISPFMISMMTLIIGSVMIILGINLTQISPKLSAISIALPTGKLFNKREIENKETNKQKKGFSKYIGAWGSGILTFFLPCGFTFAMQLYAIGSGSFWLGMAIMGLFAIGTLPGLLGIGSLTSIFKCRTAQVAYKVIGALVILLGLYNISNSYSVVSTQITKNNNGSISNQIYNQTAEIIHIEYSDQGLIPKNITLKSDKTYKIITDSQTTVYGCMSTIYLPGLDENIQSIKKGHQISFTFTATNPGEYDFVCAMGISHKAKVTIK